jgi:hypothetical protein
VILKKTHQPDRSIEVHLKPAVDLFMLFRPFITSPAFFVAEYISVPNCGQWKKLQVYLISFFTHPNISTTIL